MGANDGRASHSSAAKEQSSAAREPSEAAQSPVARALSPAAQTAFEQGCAQHAARRFDLAEQSFRAVLAEAPRHAVTLGNLAEVLRAEGKLEAALEIFAKALADNRGDALLHSNFAAALLQVGRTEDAIAELQTALALDPALHRARTNLGNAMLALGRLDEARALFEQVLAQHPDSWPALASLGAALLRAGMNEQALPHLLRAVELEPRAAEARAALAGALASTGFVEESLEQYRAALRLRPGVFEIASAFLFTLHQGAGTAPELLFAEARKLGAALEQSVAGETIRLHANDWDPNRRLRVGYVSPDLRGHPVGFFLAPVLEAHDAQAIELFAYSDTRARDAMNTRLRAAVPHFRDTAGLSDRALAAQIEADRIDVLIDLAGHTTGNRLAAFARRPAPVQLSWLGYPDTTGLTAIGWRITDAVADPPDDRTTDALHTERLLRLPHCFVAWSPARSRAPAPGAALRKIDASSLRFGCFNNIAKLSPKLAACWARILLAVPGSRLLLKSRGLSLPESRARLVSWFTRAGVSADRLELLPFGARPEDGLADYARVDLALDPFPYNGTTTTCEALSMGAPLLALRGHSHAGRVSASILESLGARELIAESEDDYVRLAVALAQDPARLSALRQELPGQFARAPAGDPQRLARELEAAFRFAWQARASQ